MIPWYFLICSWYNRANTEVGISGLVPEITDCLRNRKSVTYLALTHKLRLLDFADCLIYYTRKEVTFKLPPYEYNF